MNILFLEDNPYDIELVIEHLKKGGFDCSYTLTDTREGFAKAIEEGGFDLIFCDYSLPMFDGESALQIASRECPNVPFIFISGSLGEEVAVELLHKGATDYILKENMTRLIPSVSRALKQYQERAQLAASEEEKIKLEEQLRHSQKMDAIGQLAGGIAHDFNNLLQVILGYTDICIDQTEKNSPIVNELETIRNTASKASDLTRKLLTFGRRTVLKLTDLNVNTLIHDMMKLIKRVIPETIDISFEPGDDTGYIHADPRELEQVILNLCINARDAMPNGGTIVIRTKDYHLVEREPAGLDTGRYVEVSVEDSGTGIDQNVLNHVFEPFFTTKEAGQGTGLGLSIVYGIVKQHHGDIRVESELGSGTTFSILLPVISRPVVEREKNTTQASYGSGEKLLLVEDDALVREMFISILTRFGYKVVAASNGREAADLLEGKYDSYRLAVVDIVMPVMDGKELYNHIRARKPDFPIIITSGYSYPESFRNLNQDPHLYFLNKPFETNQILETLRHALNLHAS